MNIYIVFLDLATKIQLQSNSCSFLKHKYNKSWKVFFVKKIFKKKQKRKKKKQKQYKNRYFFKFFFEKLYFLTLLYFSHIKL